MAQRRDDFEKIDKTVTKNSPQPGPSHSPNGRAKEETLKSESSEEEESVERIAAEIHRSSERTDYTKVLPEEVLNVVTRRSHASQKGSEGDRRGSEVKEKDRVEEQRKEDEESSTPESSVGESGPDKVEEEDTEPKAVPSVAETNIKEADVEGNGAKTMQRQPSSEESSEGTVVTEGADNEPIEDDKTSSSDSQKTSNQGNAGESSPKKITIPALQLEDLGEFETASTGRLVINLDSIGGDETVSCNFVMPGTSGQSSLDKTAFFKRKIFSDSESKSDTSQEEVSSKKGKVSSSDSDCSILVAVSDSTSESGEPGVFRRLPKNSNNDEQEKEDTEESSKKPTQSFFIGYVTTSHNCAALKGLSGDKLNLNTLKESEVDDVSGLAKISTRKRKASRDDENIFLDVEPSKVLRRDIDVEKAVAPLDLPENHLSSEDSSAYISGHELSEEGGSSISASGERKTEQTEESTNDRIVSESSEEIDESVTSCERTFPKHIPPISSVTPIPGTPGTANDLYLGDSILETTTHIAALPSPIHQETVVSNSQEFNECVKELDADCPSYLKSVARRQYSPSDEASSVLPSTSASISNEAESMSTSEGSSSDISDRVQSSPEPPITIPLVALGCNRTYIPQLVYDSIIWTNYESAAEVLWKFFASPPPILIDTSNSQTYRIRPCDVRLTEEVEQDILDIVSQKSHTSKSEVRKVLEDLYRDHNARRAGRRKEPKRRRGDAEDADDEEDGDKENSSGNANSVDSSSD